MVDKYHDLFVASTGAAAAFIGLLFVAISLSPQTVFDTVARRERRIRAQRAFLALGNVFFVSLLALIPNVDAIPVLIVGVITLFQIIRDMAKAFIDEPGLKNWRQWGFVSAAVYVVEIAQARHVAKSPLGLVYTICALYCYGLFSAWTLLHSNGDDSAADGDAT